MRPVLVKTPFLFTERVMIIVAAIEFCFVIVGCCGFSIGIGFLNTHWRCACCYCGHCCRPYHYRVWQNESMVLKRRQNKGTKKLAIEFYTLRKRYRRMLFCGINFGNGCCTRCFEKVIEQLKVVSWNFGRSSHYASVDGITTGFLWSGNAILLLAVPLLLPIPYLRPLCKLNNSSGGGFGGGASFGGGGFGEAAEGRLLRVLDAELLAFQQR